MPKERVCSEQKKNAPNTLASIAPIFRGAVDASPQTLFDATGEVLLTGYQGRVKGSKLSPSGPTPTAGQEPLLPAFIILNYGILKSSAMGGAKTSNGRKAKYREIAKKRAQGKGM